MKATSLLLSCLLAAPALLGLSSFANTAQAQDEEEDDAGGGEAADGDYDYDLDLDGNKKKKKTSRSGRDRATGPVKEIVRGTYAKSNVGGAMYLGNFLGFVNPGISLGLSVGRDFVDKERMSMAGELLFFQGIHNGCNYEYQASAECPNKPGVPGPLLQGDLRTYTLAGVWEISAYPSRRMGIGFRAGGGILLSPLLMNEQYYLDDVVAGEWGGAQPAYHTTPHPVVMGGPTFEYYTKLSHFSVGADVDAFYAINFDLGANFSAYLKYTF
jgi:hypothetical protein